MAASAKTAGCFLLYVFLWTAQTLLVRSAVRANGSYAFEYASICLLTELLKLAAALLALALGGDGGGGADARDGAWRRRLWRAVQNAPAALPFAVPSVLYCAYNLLQFVNLALVPAPTFRTVINVKVLSTALLGHCAAKAGILASGGLNARQWGALCVLVGGCAVAQLDDRLQPSSAGAIALICLQGSLSSAAGVFSQWLLQQQTQAQQTHEEQKEQQEQQLTMPLSGGAVLGRVGFWERGLFLYAWGALANLLGIALFRPQLLASASAFFEGFSPLALCILLNGALAGLSTALLLRLLSALAKEFANAAEIVVTALASRALLATPLPPSLGLGSALVIGAMALFEAARESAQHGGKAPPTPDAPGVAHRSRWTARATAV